MPTAMEIVDRVRTRRRASTSKMSAEDIVARVRERRGVDTEQERQLPPQLPVGISDPQFATEDKLYMPPDSPLDIAKTGYERFKKGAAAVLPDPETDPFLIHLRDLVEKTPMVKPLPGGMEVIPNLAIGAGKLTAALPEFAVQVGREPLETAAGMAEMVGYHAGLVSRMLKMDMNAWREFNQNPVDTIVSFLIMRGIAKRLPGGKIVPEKGVTPQRLAEVEKETGLKAEGAKIEPAKAEAKVIETAEAKEPVEVRPPAEPTAVAKREVGKEAIDARAISRDQAVGKAAEPELQRRAGEEPRGKDIQLAEARERKAVSGAPEVRGKEQVHEVAKEAWEMTREEYKRYGDSVLETQRQGTGAHAYGQGARISYTAEIKAAKASTELARIAYGRGHKWNIEKALSEGKPVPAEVLKDYPDLKPAAGKLAGEEKIEEPISLQKKIIEKVREQYGREPLEPAEVERWTDAYKGMKEEGLDKNASVIAKSALEGKILNSKEETALLFRAAELADQYNTAIREAESLIDKGRIPEAKQVRERAKAISDEADLLERASATTGRETARVFNIRKMWLNRFTYDIASVHRQAKVNKGGKLTLEQERKLTKLVRDLEASEKRAAEWEQKALELEKQASKNVAGMQVTVERARATKVKETRKKIIDERENIKKQLKALGYRVNDVTGLTTEGAFLVGKLAVSHIKEGTITLSEVVRKVLKDVPDINEYDVYSSLNARNPKAVRKARNETQKRISQIKTEARLLKEIEDAGRGVFVQKGIKTKPSNEIVRLRNKLKKLRTEAFAGDYEAKRLEKIIKSITEIQDQLDYQYRTIRKEKHIDTEGIKEAKQKLRDLRSMMNAQDKLAEYNHQLKTGDFEIKPEPVKRTIPPELERAKFDVDQAKRAVDQAVDELRPRTKKEIAAEIIGLPRTIKATADMSYALRQGLILSVTRPKLATKAFGKAFKAFFSQKKADKIDYEIRSHPNHYMRVKSGLYIGSIDGKILAREEIFMSRIAQKIPLFGEVVKASERNMITGLNLLRTGVFDKFLEHNPNATHVELKAMADYINVASGRGDLGRFSQAADILSLGIFAPRFAASRFQAPYRLPKYWKLPRIRKAIAKDLAGFIGTGVTVLTLADLAGFRVGKDPQDSDFGKIVIGNTRIDIWGGTIQVARLFSRTFIKPLERLNLVNKDLPDYAKRTTLIDLWEQFASFKLSPAITITSELVAGKTIVGQKVKPTETIIKATLPFVVEATYEAINEESVIMGGVTVPLEAVGMSVTTYKETEGSIKHKRGIKKAEIRNMFNRGKSSKAYREIKKWNERYPKFKIKLSEIK